MGLNIWLDDDPKVDGKSTRPAPKGFVHVHNLAELEELLNSTEGRIEVMSFDHDLGDWAEDGTELTGRYVIEWLQREHLDRYPKEVRVHSANQIGRENVLAFDASVRKHLLNE